MSFGLIGGGLAGIQSMQFFESSGTWTKPVGIKKALFIAVGGGGGGGGGGSNKYSGSGGGGAGEISVRLLDVTSISSYAIVVGAGGVGANNTSGTDGGKTSVGGTVLEASGGSGGERCFFTDEPGIGGAGGTTAAPVNCDFALVGRYGETGHYGSGATHPGVGGRGGAGFLGYGYGAGGNYESSNTRYGFPAAAGSTKAYGAGGGGACGTGTAEQSGGDGADGFVWVWEIA